MNKFWKIFALVLGGALVLSFAINIGLTQKTKNKNQDNIQLPLEAGVAKTVKITAKVTAKDIYH